MSNTIVSNDDFKYVIENKKARLCSYCGSNQIVTIPNTLGGYAVTSIGCAAFHRCQNLKEVIIPNSVTHISNSAFYGFKNLTRVEIPNSVTSIGKEVFGKCFGLTEIELNEDNPVYRFFEGALFDKTKGELITYFGRKDLLSYVIPNFVTSIAHNAFMDCVSLTSVEIPDSVTSIGKKAFKGCTSLREVIIPNSITSIGKGAFDDGITIIRKKSSHGVWRNGVFTEIK